MSLIVRRSAARLFQSFCICICARVRQDPREGRLPAQPKSKSWQHIEAAVLYISRHFEDPALDNTSVSRATGLSPNHLTSLFKRYLDIPCMNTSCGFRLKKAKQF